MDDLKIRQKTEEMIAYGYTAVRQFPKSERHVLAQEIRLTMWAILRLIIVTNRRYYKKTTMQDLDAELDVLRSQIRISMELKFLPFQKYKVWSRHVDEIGRMIGGWFKSIQQKICRDVAAVIEASGGRFAMDATGLGMQLGEELSGEFPCVEPVNFATAVESDTKDQEGKPLKVLVKERMAGLLKRRCEDRMIWLPESAELRREFQAVKRYVGATGAVRLDAGRTEKGHADWFWAMALMCGAMEGPRHEYIPASAGGVLGDTVLGRVMEAVF